MTKFRMQIELEYDAEQWHGEGEESKEWFFNDVLKGGLSLFSDEAGDVIGKVRIIEQE